MRGLYLIFVQTAKSCLLRLTLPSPIQIQHGVARTLDLALEHLESSNPGCPYHLSFDIDSFDKSVAPSTGFPSPAGLNEREVRETRV
jgi:arginase family enzyme